MKDTLERERDLLGAFMSTKFCRQGNGTVFRRKSESQVKSIFPAGAFPGDGVSSTGAFPNRHGRAIGRWRGILGFFLLWSGSGFLLSQDVTPGQRAAYEECRTMQEKGDWNGARELARKLVREIAGGPDSRTKLAFTNELANLDQRLGDYGEAARGYRECLRIADRLQPEPGTVHAQLKNNLAALYQVLGDFAGAEPLARESLALRRRLDGKDSPSTVPALNNLAGLYWCIGDLAAAESHYREALAIRERGLGSGAPETALSRANLGGLLFYRDRWREAEPLVREATQTLRRTRGENHPDTLDALLFLGEIERAKGNPEAALADYRACLAGRVRAFGTREHVEVAEAERRIGDALRESGRYEESLASYAASTEHYLAVLRTDHLDLLEGTYGAGLSALARGDRPAALLQAGNAFRIERSNLEAILGFTDERQRLAYQDMFRSMHLFANLGAAEELADFLTSTKGVVLDSLIGEARLIRQSDDPAVVATQEAIRAARAKYRTAFLGRERPGSERELTEATRTLESRIRTLQQQVGRTTDPVSFLPRTSAAEVRAALGEREALVDFFAYDQYRGKAEFVTHYGAVVSRRGSVRFHDCGPTGESEELISELAPFFSDTRQRDDGKAESLMRQLHSRLIAPILSSLDGVDHLMISPAGKLNFVPFACLIGPDGAFLAERFQVDYLSTARAALGGDDAARQGKGALLLGNPDYDLSTQDGSREAASGGRGILANYGTALLTMVAQHLRPLAGTESEVRQLASLLDRHGYEVTLITRDEATEKNLAEHIRHPGILHLATHGVYLGVFSPRPGAVQRQSGYAPDELAGFHNPMFESWLALSGAQRTVEGWANGKVEPSDNDGILMANEAAELDLAGTGLVTLSACDTAAGRATGGDGVLGLRRGFQLAGARAVLSTLWPIDDLVTVDMMTDFYEELRQSSPETALGRVQREWLPKLRKQAGLHQAVSLAGPFVLCR